MPNYKEVVKLDKVTHNGVSFQKGAVVRPVVYLSEINAKHLNDDPTITGCQYILIEEEKKPIDDKKAAREALKARATELKLEFAKNATNEQLEELIKNAENVQ